MTDIFSHQFGGHRLADAYRWRNTDGTLGGVVAQSAMIDPSVFLHASVEVFPHARIISNGRRALEIGVSIGRGVSIGEEVRIAGATSIGDGTQIGYGARIGYCAKIGDGAKIGDDAVICPQTHIGTGAHIGDSTRIGYGVRIGVGARVGPGVSITDGAIYDAGDWLFVAGPQGPERECVTAVYSAKHGLRWWAGFQLRGAPEDFRRKVVDLHGEDIHASDYLALISFVESHPGLLRAMAAAGVRHDPVVARGLRGHAAETSPERHNG